MAACRECGDFVVFLKRPDGSGKYMRPVVPVQLEHEGALFIADAEGVGQPPPQLYEPHVCLTPDEQARRREALKEEKQRLIEADRERRRIAEETKQALRARADAERIAEQEAHEAEADRLALEEGVTAEDEEWLEPVQHAPLKDLLDFRRKDLHHMFRAQHAGAVWAQFNRSARRIQKLPCRGCGALANEPCWAPEQPTEIQILGHTLAIRLGLLSERVDIYNVATPNWFASNACSERWVGATAVPIRGKRREYFGEEYDGPWPPEFSVPGRELDLFGLTVEGRGVIHHAGAGAYDMRNFLSQNVDLFNVGTEASPDAYRKPRRFLTNVEVSEMTGWLRQNGPILWANQEEVPDGTGTVAQDDWRGRSEGVLRDGGADGSGADAREVEAAGDPVRAEGSGRALEGDGEHEDRT